MPSILTPVLGKTCNMRFICFLTSSFISFDCMHIKALSFFEQLRKGDPYQKIPMFLIPHIASSTDSSGGITVESNSVVRLYGEMVKILAVTKAVALDKFSRLKFTVENPVSEVSICLYENDADISRQVVNQCYKAEAGNERNVDIRAGALFSDKKAGVIFVKLEQKELGPVKAEAFISTISLSPGKNVDIIDDNGLCKDPNANTLIRSGKTVCQCADSYMSSNGGRIQNKSDSCVHCLISKFCVFEGGICITDEECIWNSCVRGKCEALQVNKWPARIESM